MRQKLTKTLLITALLLPLITGCGARPNSPSGAIERMYDAISERNLDDYMSALRPANRRQPNIVGLLAAISVVGVEYGPVTVEFDSLLQTPIHDVQTRIVYQTSDYALVQARGNIRMPILLMEVPFCEEHDVVRENGEWYVDIYHPNRNQRTEQLLARLENNLASHLTSNSQSNQGSSGDLFTELNSMLGAFGQGMELGLDQCLIYS